MWDLKVQLDFKVSKVALVQGVIVVPQAQLAHLVWMEIRVTGVVLVR